MDVICSVREFLLNPVQQVDAVGVIVSGYELGAAFRSRIGQCAIEQ